MPFLKIFFLIYLSYTLPSSAERRAGEDRENNGTNPRQQKVLFVNICHRHWLFSARSYPCESPSVPFSSLPVTLVHPVLPFPFLLAVLLCGVPETLVASWGAICGSAREKSALLNEKSP